MTTDTPLWRREFGDRFDVPASIQNHPQLVDISWHNDVCPSFIVQGYDHDYGGGLRLWVHPLDKSVREYPGLDRFVVCNNDGDVLFESDDDPDAAIAALLHATSTAIPDGTDA